MKAPPGAGGAVSLVRGSATRSCVRQTPSAARASAGQHAQQQSEHAPDDGQVDGGAVKPAGRAAHGAEVGAAATVEAGAEAGLLGLLDEEIGRASCRERV